MLSLHVGNFISSCYCRRRLLGDKTSPDIFRHSAYDFVQCSLDIFKMDEEYRNLLGYLPQDFGYYPDFTGMDFLMYMAALIFRLSSSICYLQYVRRLKRCVLTK